MSPSAVERLFKDREHSMTDDSFAIHLKGEGEPIGVISLMNISEANDSAELSVIVGRPEDRHHGYGAEAIGTLRQALKRNGAFHDAILMSVLGSEWESTDPRS